MVHASLFTGIGGFDLAAEWCGWQNSFQCEIDPFCQKVLAKNFPHATRYTNIKEFDARRYRGTVDVLSGGFPCQPFSLAGQRRGSSDDRALWPEMLRVIDEVRPRWVVGENVAGLASLGLDSVLFDLEASGYACETVLLPACGVGAPHRRDRLWIIAHAGREPSNWGQVDQSENGIGHGPHGRREETANQFAGPGATAIAHAHGQPNKRQRVSGCVASAAGASKAECEERQWDGDAAGHSSEATTNAACQLLQVRQRERGHPEQEQPPAARPIWRLTEPPLRRSNDGLPIPLVRPGKYTSPIRRERAKQLKAYGNSIVPQVALEIFKAIDAIDFAL